MLFPWLVWCLLVLKPFSLVFSAPVCLASGEKSRFSGPVMPDPWRKRKQRKRLTGPPAFPGRAIPSRGQWFSRITRHETRLFPWLVWCSLVLKPFSLFFGRGLVYVESDDAVVGNKNPIRARRGQVGWGQKSRPSRGLSGFHESRDTRHESRLLLWRGMGRLWRGMGDPSRCFSVHDCSPLFTIVRHCSAKNITPEPVSPLHPHRQRGR